MRNQSAPIDPLGFTLAVLERHAADHYHCRENPDQDANHRGQNCTPPNDVHGYLAVQQPNIAVEYPE